MPQGQSCGHCRQPDHNVRTCEAYERYVTLEEELEATRSELRETKLAQLENENIIKVQAARISQLSRAVQRLTAERDRLRALLGGMAVSSIGTGKGISQHPDH